MKLALLTGLALGALVAIEAAEPLPSKPKAPTPPPAAPVPPLSPEAAKVLKNDVDQFSYSLGVGWGNSFRQQFVDINPEILLRGIQDGITNKETLMTPAQMKAAQDEMRKVVMAKRDVKMKEMGAKNLAESQKFMAENAKKEGVKTMPSGLQYKVLKEGTGPKPTETDHVAVQYTGKMLNGIEFDSSRKRGPAPAIMPVNRVIKGMTEALTNMPVGSKWELYIPPDLGYEERGYNNIEPNAALIFEVELVEIKPPEPPAQPVVSDIVKVPSKAEYDAGARPEYIKQEDLKKYTTNKVTPPKPGGPPSAVASPAPAPKKP